MNIEEALKETQKYFHYMPFKTFKFDGNKIKYTVSWNNPNENYDLINDYFYCCLTDNQHNSLQEKIRLRNSADSVLHWKHRKIGASFEVALDIYQHCIKDIKKLYDAEIEIEKIKEIENFINGMNSWYEI